MAGSSHGPARALPRLHERFTDHPARLARLLLGQLDELTAWIEEVTGLLDAAIRALPTPTPTATATGGASAVAR